VTDSNVSPLIKPDTAEKAQWHRMKAVDSIYFRP
jgi:hypothetical protein